MIKDHSSADDKPKNIAASQHVGLPIELDPKHKQTDTRLAALSGKEFDKAYMQLMVQNHTKAVSEFQKEAANANDDTVKQFAAATLPVLQSHLQEAQQIEKQVGIE
jgi:putative membrane protein